MYKIKIEEAQHEVDIRKDHISVDGESFSWDLVRTGDHAYHIIKDDTSYRVQVIKVDHDTKSVQLKINGTPYQVSLQDKFDLLLEKLGMDQTDSTKLQDLKAPMPGLICDIQVAVGDEVEKGDPLMILEAMKMENVIKAGGTGVVKAVKVKKGDSVEKNQVLIQF